MITETKIDKLDFTVKKTLLAGRLEEFKAFLSRNKVTPHNSPCHLTVHLNPTKLRRPDVTYDDSMEHNLQMNVDLLEKFLEELNQYVNLETLKVKEIHIAKDRLMEHPVETYYEPLMSNQTRYKGRTKAYETNNGTTPSICIGAESDRMNNGSSCEIKYKKNRQLQDELRVDEITPIESLKKEEIEMLGSSYSKYTGRVKLKNINLMRSERKLKGNKLLLFPNSDGKLTLADVMKMIKDDTLIDTINKVYVDEKIRTIFPDKKEPTKDNDLDKFLVAGNMSRFDNLFSALGIYQNYKEYTNSVILNDDLLLEEIYEKFVLN